MGQQICSNEGRAVMRPDQGTGLPPGLETGHIRIDEEHRRLLFQMDALCGICIDPQSLKDCTSCRAARQLDCEGRLVPLLGDLFASMLDHFASEEQLMRDAHMHLRDGDLCAAHIEDHAAIAQKVQELVSRLDVVHTVERIRELDSLLRRWVAHHVEMHDNLLVHWLAGHGMPGSTARR